MYITCRNDGMPLSHFHVTVEGHRQPILIGRKIVVNLRAASACWYAGEPVFNMLRETQ